MKLDKRSALEISGSSGSDFLSEVADGTVTSRE